jgi:lysozyme-related protein Hpa2
MVDNTTTNGTRRGHLVAPTLLMYARILIACAVVCAVQTARADCFDDAAVYHRVNPIILRSIAVVESGDKPWATNRNANGSEDDGEMQINSIHLPELAQYGMSRHDLFDACKSIYTGAWIYRKQIDKYGNTWAAVGAYHSATPYYRDQYAAKVRAVAMQLAREYGAQ